VQSSSAKIENRKKKRQKKGKAKRKVLKQKIIERIIATTINSNSWKPKRTKILRLRGKIMEM
jgi:hypothetical protein